MTIGPLILVFIIIIWGIVMTVPDEDKKELILLDEIRVGDKVMIKGELFDMISYSPGGVMEIKNEKGEYIINTKQPNVHFYLHKSGSRRKYVDIVGLKGTIGSDYLDKIKFN